MVEAECNVAYEVHPRGPAPPASVMVEAAVRISTLSMLYGWGTYRRLSMRWRLSEIPRSLAALAALALGQGFAPAQATVDDMLAFDGDAVSVARALTHRGLESRFYHQMMVYPLL